MRYLIGIDDTDDSQGRGTGFRARKLGAALGEAGLATLVGITRHQLLLAPQIRYTSHNSAACLALDLHVEPETVFGACRDFLRQESAPGADAGLCLAPWEAVGPALQAFGARAKREVLTAAEALELARQERLLLEGVTGDGSGVIGALASLGLRAGGNDGRFIWLEGVRDLSGAYTAETLCSTTGIEEVCTPGGAPIPSASHVDVGPWVRPVLRGGRAVLLVEASTDPGNGQWRVLSKEAIKAQSD